MEMFFTEGTNHNLILDILRYWVRVYRVDGFHLLGTNLPITAIVQDNVLSRTKIFYEELNESVCSAGRKYKNLYVYKEEYMYPARRVLNHLNGNMRDFADQQRKQGAFLGYVNYIASNNGFTLADLFMYNDKHNEENGEKIADGNAWNFSNNYGVEGPTKKRYINAIRRLKWRNSILMLFLAQGVPLLWQGDEMGNSQGGNNNAYCQDNPTGWLNWKNEKTHRKELRFLRQVIAFRKEHPILSNEMPFQFSDYKSVGCPDLSFHGESAWIMEPIAGRMSLGMMYCGAYAQNAEADRDAEDVYVAYNFSSGMTSMALPDPVRGRRWYLAIDSGNDAMPFLEEPVVCAQGSVVIRSQSIQVFVSRAIPEQEPKTRTKKGRIVENE
jgi:glycogen operon protein